MNEMMYNNAPGGYFNQGGMMGFAQPNTYYGGMMPSPNGGLTFNNVISGKKSNLTVEELDSIMRKNGGLFSWTEDDDKIARWNLRDGNATLMLTLIDPSKDRMKPAVGEEFSIINTNSEEVELVLDMLYSLSMSAKVFGSTNFTQQQEEEIQKAVLLLKKNFAKYYIDSTRNYETVSKNMSNMFGTSGFGYQNINTMMNNCMGGMAPNYYINMGSTPPQNNYYYGGNVMNPMMGVPQPMGGTMMGSNPFMQGGGQQMIPNIGTPAMTATPTMTAPTQQPAVPMPGTPTTPNNTTPNPAIGATTAKAPF